MSKKLNHAYYFKPIKIVRDLVHEYVNLTRFDLDIIDTLSFQRLKDIRQLTCQHVYPAACHTRFEHSLGVLELTRQAIKHLNKNGILGVKNEAPLDLVINKHLEYNASLAALLHDVGHCPFSHMGETEFNSEEVREYLFDVVSDNEHLETCSDLLKKLEKPSAKGIGAIHEQLSCIIILEKYYALLAKIGPEASSDPNMSQIKTDYELIIRSILGIEYDVSTLDLFEKNNKKNVIVRLINSNIFDMDKLDYIMRDSYFTGIGTPAIDTRRLFRNIHFGDNLSLVFTSRAVPALQNMIDSRDGLYMYVYNHHAVIFSDFMNTYISRRLSHNANLFLSTINPNMNDEELKDELECFQISSLGLIPKPYLFSVEAVLDGYRSDSDWISLLNIIHFHYLDNYQLIEEVLKEHLTELSPKNKPSFTKTSMQKLITKIYQTLELVHQYKTRQFLKPWWKTVFEFSNFMNQYFRDDSIRKRVGKFICTGGRYNLDAAEFRSQIAKHVIFITQELKKTKKTMLIEHLNDGDFFIIQRTTRFFSPNTIERLEICLKSSEITGPPVDIDEQLQEYYVKALTNIIPQKDYSSIYAKEGFYVFSKPLVNEKDEQKRIKHYRFVEQIFVFVATELARKGEQEFTKSFQPRNGESALTFKQRAAYEEQASMKEMLSLFRQQYIL